MKVMQNYFIGKINFPITKKSYSLWQFLMEWYIYERYAAIIKICLTKMKKFIQKAIHIYY